MKKISICCSLLLCAALVFGQKETFDLASYTPLKGWKKQIQADARQFSKEDAAKGTYCLITLYKSLDAGADAKENFDLSWEALVKEQLDSAAAPEMQPATTENGWEIHSGYAAFEKDGTKGIAILAASTGFGKLMTVLIITNTDAYEKEMMAFLGSIDLKKPAAVKKPDEENNVNDTNVPSKPAANTKFKFSTTNFDDGWVATEQEDWVEVIKGNIKVLLHYPKQGTIISADPVPFINNAWDILVAPRYDNIREYVVAKTITEYERGYLSAGFVTDKATGKEVFVSLFRKGHSGFIEIITPDKETFIQAFGFDLNTITWTTDSDIWKPLVKLADYNKFAIAASDFTGTWTSDFSGAQQLYNVYTGQYAGMNVHQSSETFEFKAANGYHWKLLAVNGMVGSMNYAQVKSDGKFSVLNNWQIHFTKIESKAKTFDAHFSCIKGGRILWLQDTKYPSGYTQYGRK